jgi:Cu(I)/Ag(I) efflux system membrane protein CusA/SilA
VLKRIATPMMGGVVTSNLMELLVYPAIYYLWRSRSLKGAAPAGAAAGNPGVTGFAA